MVKQIRSACTLPRQICATQKPGQLQSETECSGTAGYNPESNKHQLTRGCSSQPRVRKQLSTPDTIPARATAPFPSPARAPPGQPSARRGCPCPRSASPRSSAPPGFPCSRLNEDKTPKKRKEGGNKRRTQDNSRTTNNTGQRETTNGNKRRTATAKGERTRERDQYKSITTNSS